MALFAADHFMPAMRHVHAELFSPADRLAAAAQAKGGKAATARGLNDGITRPAAALLWVSLIIMGVFFWPLWSTRFLPENPDGSVRSGGSCWADLPIHMHMMQAFLVGRNQDISFFGLHSPIFAGRPMSYPFIPDFHSAILVKLGFNMRWGMLLPGFMMFISCMGLAYCLAYRVSRSSLGSLAGCIIVILSGGVGGINWLLKNPEQAPNHDPMQDDPSSGRGNGSVFWFAFLPHVMMPQRAATYGYPVALLAVIITWLSIKSQSTLKLDTRRRLLLVAAIICGLLPLVHAHSFVCMAVIVGSLCLMDLHAYGAEPMQMTAWLPAGVTCLLMFLPQFMLIKKMEEEDTGKHTIEPAVIFHGHDRGDVAWALGKVGMAFLAQYIPRFWRDFLTFMFRSTTFTGLLYFIGVVSFIPYILVTLRAAFVYVRSGDIPVGLVDPNMRQALLLEAGGRAKKDDDAKRARGEGSFADESVYVTKLQDVNRIRSRICAEPNKEVTRFDDVLAAADMVGPSRRIAGAKLGVATVILLFVGLLIKFQPWDKDNTKLYLLWLLISAGYVGGAVMWPIDAALGPVLDRVAGAVDGVIDSVLGTGVIEAPPAKDEVEDEPAVGGAKGAGEAGVPDDKSTAAEGGSSGLRARANRKSGPGSDGKEEEAGDDGKDAKAEGASPSAKPGAGKASSGLSIVLRGAYLLLGLCGIALAAVSCVSGWMSIEREFRMDHELYGNDEKDMAKYLIEHVSPKAVVVHKNDHRSLSGMLAGKPSLVAYDGWMWSHGYNYGDRHTDRNTIVDHLVKDSDPENYQRMRRWGVRYVLSENTYHWPTKRNNPSVFLDGKLKRVHQSGRFELFEVLGYGFEPT